MWGGMGGGGVVIKLEVFDFLKFVLLKFVWNIVVFGVVVGFFM